MLLNIRTKIFKQSSILINKFISNLFKFAAIPLLFLLQQYIKIRCYYRLSYFANETVKEQFWIDGVLFRLRHLAIEGFQHRVTETGDLSASNENTIIFMGGIPTDSSETFYWLVAQIYKKNNKLRCIIIHLPFMEEHCQLEYDEFLTSQYFALTLPFFKKFSLSKFPIDPRFDHINQAKTTRKIIEQLNIEKAHFVGHDRGAVIFDYLIGEHPNLAFTFSRGSQLWDYYDNKWMDLAPKYIVGPPHRLMTLPWQLQLLFSLIIIFKKPICVLSPNFINEVKKVNKGTEAYDRKTHLLYKTLNLSKSTKLKIQQIMLQTDSRDEVLRREPLKISRVPIMQFQGEDEFAFDAKGTLISDQPYFGKFNLFPNDVFDLYPGCIGQEIDSKKSEILTNKGRYQTLKLLDTSRLNRFCLIPKAAHFNVVENPEACADAILDFINYEKNL